MIIDAVDPETGQRYIYIDDTADGDACERPSHSSYANGCRCWACRAFRNGYEQRRRALAKQKAAS